MVPLSDERVYASVDDTCVRVRMSWLGGADIPLEQIAGIGSLRWPPWGGLGVRLGGGMVAFVASSGPAVAIELSEPLRVRAPLRWTAGRIVVSVEDADSFTSAIAERRDALRSP